MDGTILIFAVLLGLIPAVIAANKGHNFFLWWIFGATIFIIALPVAILTKPNTKEIEQHQIQSGEMKKCPYCAETIKSEALICKYCGKDLSQKAEIQNVKQLKSEFSAFLRWNESIGANTARVLQSSNKPFDEKTSMIFVVYKDTKKFRINDIAINNKSLESKHSCLIATQDRLICVDPNKPFIFDCAYKDIATVTSTKMLNNIVFTMQTQTKLKIVLNFEASNNATENELSRFTQLLISFFNVALRENSPESQIKMQATHNQATHNNLPVSNVGFRDDLFEAELALSNGDKKAAALIIDKILKQDFVNQAAWQLLYQLLGNGKEFSAFQKEFASKYYPDKIDLLFKQ